MPEKPVRIFRVERTYVYTETGTVVVPDVAEALERHLDHEFDSKFNADDHSILRIVIFDDAGKLVYDSHQVVRK